MCIYFPGEQDLGHIAKNSSQTYHSSLAESIFKFNSEKRNHLRVDDSTGRIYLALSREDGSVIRETTCMATCLTAYLSYIQLVSPIDTFMTSRTGTKKGGRQGGTLYLLNLQRRGRAEYNLDAIKSFELPAGSVTTLAVAVDGSRIVVGDEVGNVMLFDSQLQELWKIDWEENAPLVHNDCASNFTFQAKPINFKQMYPLRLPEYQQLLTGWMRHNRG